MHLFGYLFVCPCNDCLFVGFFFLIQVQLIEGSLASFLQAVSCLAGAKTEGCVR